MENRAEETVSFTVVTVNPLLVRRFEVLDRPLDELLLDEVFSSWSVSSDSAATGGLALGKVLMTLF